GGPARGQRGASGERQQRQQREQVAQADPQRREQGGVPGVDARVEAEGQGDGAEAQGADPGGLPAPARAPAPASAHAPAPVRVRSRRWTRALARTSSARRAKSDPAWRTWLASGSQAGTPASYRTRSYRASRRASGGEETPNAASMAPACSVGVAARSRCRPRAAARRSSSAQQAMMRERA